MLVRLDLRHLLGIEIGPLTTPIVARNQGAIIYVDHVDTEALRQKYQNHPTIDVESIVNVDAVWGKSTLQEAIGVGRKVDYVLASHVVEHVPDLLGWLSEVREVLRPNCELRLLIPDRRYTFDRLRRETRLADILYARLARARAPLAPMILDHVLEVVQVDHRAAWRGEIAEDTLSRLHSLEHALTVAEDALRNGTYHDVHCWVFTPASFANLMARACELKLVGFECADFEDTNVDDIDFFVGMRRCDNADLAAASWRRMATAVRLNDVQ